MNEVLMKKHLNRVVKHGIPKNLAMEIVKTSMIASKGKNVETYIDYALKLVYGMNFSTQKTNGMRG